MTAWHGRSGTLPRAAAACSQPSQDRRGRMPQGLESVHSTPVSQYLSPGTRHRMARYSSLWSWAAVVSWSRLPCASQAWIGCPTRQLANHLAEPRRTSESHLARSVTRWQRQHTSVVPPSQPAGIFRRALAGRSVCWGAPSDLAVEVEQVRKMRVGEIQKELRSRNLSHTDCFEKEELVSRLAIARVQGSQAPPKPPPSRGGATVGPEGIVVPMVRLKPSSNVLGAGVSVDQKDYYAIALDLPSLKGGLSTIFVIDTAATSSLITPEAAARLGATKTGVTATAAAGTGSMGGLSQVRLGEVQLAGRSCGPLNPVVMALPISDDQKNFNVAGILGMDFLSRFDVLIDFNADQVTLATPGTASSGGLGSRGMTELQGSMLVPPGFFVVDAVLGRDGKTGKPFPGIVDFGSAFTIINWLGVGTVDMNPRSPGIRNTGQVVAGASAPGQAYTPLMVQEAEFSLTLGKGGAKLSSHKCSIGDLPGFNAIGHKGAIMVLGTDVLKRGGGKVIMSLQQKKMWLAF